MHALSTAALFQFYNSLQGQYAAACINSVLDEIGPLAPHGTFLGMGYPLPFVKDHPRCIWTAPSVQGVFSWPDSPKKRCVMVKDRSLPFSDASIDSLLLVHTLEHMASDQHCLREIWRVLSSGAMLYVIVPNRLGFWSKSDATPFGQGKPYSLLQIRTLLESTCFMPLMCKQALYGWPSGLSHENHPPSSASRFFGAFCEKFMDEGGGVHIIQAQKQLLAPTSMVQNRYFSLMKKKSASVFQTKTKT